MTVPEATTGVPVKSPSLDWKLHALVSPQRVWLRWRQEDGQPAPGGGAATTIKETEYALAPGTVQVTKTGTVTLTAQTAGKMTHALEIEGNGVEKKTAKIQPGSSAKLTVNLKPGTYDLYCPIDGHRQLGMKATVTVGG